MRPTSISHIFNSRLTELSAKRQWLGRGGGVPQIISETKHRSEIHEAALKIARWDAPKAFLKFDIGSQVAGQGQVKSQK